MVRSTARLLLGAVVVLVATAGAVGAQDEGAATVSFVSGIPDRGVDLYFDGERVKGGVDAGQIAEGLSLPAGEHELEVRPAGAHEDTRPIAEGRVTLAAASNVTLAAHLDEDGLGRMSSFENDLSPLGAGEARLSVRHAAAVPTVDVRVSGRRGFSDLANGRAATEAMAPGDARVQINLAGEGEPLVGPADVSLAEGALTAVFAVGSARDDTLDFVVQTIPVAAAPAPGATGVMGRQVSPGTDTAPAGTTVLTAIHGIPETPMDVYLDGEPRLTDFEPGTMTEAMSLPAGDVDVEIREAGAPEPARPVLATTLSLAPGTNVTVVAHLTASGFPTLTSYTNDLSALGAGQSRLTVRHLAAMGPGEVRSGGQALLPGLRNGQEQSTVVPAGSVSAELALAGQRQTLLGPSALTLPEGTSTIVYAVGSAEEDSLELLVQSIPGLYSAPVGAAAGDGGLTAPGGIPLWVVAVMLGATVTGVVSARRLHAAHP